MLYIESIRADDQLFSCHSDVSPAWALVYSPPHPPGPVLPVLPVLLEVTSTAGDIGAAPVRDLAWPLTEMVLLPVSLVMTVLLLASSPRGARPLGRG